MFVMVFVVETIKIFCDGFIFLFIFFSVGHKPVSVIQWYVAAVCHMTSMRAPPLLVPPQNNECIMPLTLQYKLLLNNCNMMKYLI